MEPHVDLRQAVEVGMPRPVVPFRVEAGEEAEAFRVHRLHPRQVFAGPAVDTAVSCGSCWDCAQSRRTFYRRRTDASC